MNNFEMDLVLEIAELDNNSIGKDLLYDYISKVNVANHIGQISESECFRLLNLLSQKCSNTKDQKYIKQIIRETTTYAELFQILKNSLKSEDSPKIQSKSVPTEHVLDLSGLKKSQPIPIQRSLTPRGRRLIYTEPMIKKHVTSDAEDY